MNEHLNLRKIQKVKISDLENIEQVRQSYKAILQTKEQDITPNMQKQNHGNIESQKDESLNLNQSQKQVHKKRIRQKPKY